jgi:boron transporter
MTAIFNWCDYMRYVTDYSSNTFALYVGTIYISTTSLFLASPPSFLVKMLIMGIVKGVEELSINFHDDRIANGFIAVVIAILYTITVYLLEKIRGTVLFTEGIRESLSDYAYPVNLST